MLDKTLQEWFIQNGRPKDGKKRVAESVLAKGRLTVAMLED